jgi:hypothetical protein
MRTSRRQLDVRVLMFVCALLGVGMAAQQATSPPSAAVPLDPVATILDAFRSHDIVALGEGAHGNEQGHAFRLSLIRHPRFSTLVNDIVVEFGNARYQDVMDRFVRGESVPDVTLREVWQNTTQAAPIWDRPIYEEFFRVVRAVNVTLTPARRLRVLLGDPPIEWENVHTAEDVNKWMADGNRDRHPADVIRREVLAKQRRALVIYGEGHLARPSRSIVQLLESSATTKVFTIASPISMPTATPLTTLEANAGAWPVPSIAMLRGTALGAADITAFFATPAAMRQGKPAAAGPNRPPLPRLEDQFDALLYLGEPSTITMNRLSPKQCADTAYIDMRLKRLALLPSPLSKIQTDRFREECPGTVK